MTAYAALIRKRFMRASPVIYHDVDTLSESPSGRVRAKPSDESSGRNGPSRGLVPLKATTSKIETTRIAGASSQGDTALQSTTRPGSARRRRARKSRILYCEHTAVPKRVDVPHGGAFARGRRCVVAHSSGRCGGALARPDDACAEPGGGPVARASSRCRSAPPCPARRRALSVRL